MKKFVVALSLLAAFELAWVSLANGRTVGRLVEPKEAREVFGAACAKALGGSRIQCSDACGTDQEQFFQIDAGQAAVTFSACDGKVAPGASGCLESIVYPDLNCSSGSGH